MKTGMTALLVAGGMLALIFVAGFFHDGKRSENCASCAPAAKPCPAAPPAFNDAPRAGNPRAESGLLGNRAYTLQCDCTLKVKKVLEMEETLKSLLAEHRGTVEELEINGTERGREGFAVVSIPTDRFDPFVKAVRGLGSMERERVTAKAWKPGGAGSSGADAETAAVTLHFSDIASSPVVDESKGLLATSFGRSASHFLKGLAVLVEAVGYVLPFLAAALLLFGPAFVIVKVTRRLRATHAA